MLTVHLFRLLAISCIYVYIIDGFFSFPLFQVPQLSSTAKFDIYTEPISF